MSIFPLQLACETFCLEEDEALAEVKQALCGESLSPDTVRFVNAKEDSLDSGNCKYLILHIGGSLENFGDRDLERKGVANLISVPLRTP